MVDWSSTEVLRFSAEFAERLNVFLFGVYSWYFLTTLHHVEIPLFRRRLKLRWALIPYLGARYCLLACIIGFQTNLCGPANETFWVIGCMAVIFASENLLMRAYTLWSGNIYAIIVLTILALGHWAVGIAVFFVPVVNAWIQYASTCKQVTGEAGPMPFYLYTMLFDLSILFSTVLGLFRIREARSSPLWVRLCRQGFVYFLATFLVNLLTLIFSLLALSSTQSGDAIPPRLNRFLVYLGDIFSAPAVTVSVMASSHAVISLLKMHDVEEGRSSPTRRSHSSSKTASTVHSQAFSTNINFSLSIIRNSGEIVQSVVVRTPTSPNIPIPPRAADIARDDARASYGIGVRIIPVQTETSDGNSRCDSPV